MDKTKEIECTCGDFVYQHYMYPMSPGQCLMPGCGCKKYESHRKSMR